MRKASHNTRQDSMESSDKQVKRVLRIGKYEVVHHIATGGMGAVYKALDTDLNRPVALKVLSTETAAKPTMLKRFRQEARNAAKLRHENIVAVYEFGEYAGTHFLALEYVEGKDLHAHVSRKGKLDAEEARQIVIQAAMALDHAHSHGIVHRDIKPSNLMVTQKDGNLLIKLTDFGLARQVDDDEFKVTREGTTIGTVDYMAPEQARRSQAADVRSDIYSLGCTLFHMLSGRCPFPSGTLPERIMQHLEVEPPEIRTLNASVSEGLAIILRRMLAKKPAERYQTPLDLLKDLETPERLQDYQSKNEQLRNLAELAAEVKPIKKHAPPVAEADGKERRAKAPIPWAKRPAHLRRKRGEQEASETPNPWPVWWPIAACLGLALIVGGILLLQPWPSPPPIKDDKVQPEPPPKVATKEQGKEKEPAPKPQPPPKEPIGSKAPAYPRVPGGEKFDSVAWPREVFGPFQKIAAPVSHAKTVIVSRLAAPGQFHSIAEALAQTAGPAILEIHDNGPLFEASLPPMVGREITIRAGPGFRPLLAWEQTSASKKDTSQTAAAFLAVSEAGLILEDLDIVGKWSGLAGGEPPCFFRVQSGDFQAKGCTFSVAGKHPRGIRLVQLTGSAPALPSKPGKCRLSQCLVRGEELTPVFVDKTSAEILFDRSLLVGGSLALVQVAVVEDESVSIRLVRSTLIAAQEICRWHVAPGRASVPKLQCLAWDTLLGRSWPPAAASGDMIRLEGNARSMSWRAVNCVYAGWKHLLQAENRSFAAAAIDSWRAHFHYRDGDIVSEAAWPGHPIASAHLQPAKDYATLGSPVCYAATADAGMLGCVLSALPEEPPFWLQRTFERFSAAAPEPTAFDEPPPIPAPADGFYHGERIDLAKGDPGVVLKTRLQSAKPAARVVLHLVGKGKHQIEPIHVRGIERLVLYFEPVKEKDEPIALYFKPGPPGEREAMLDVVEGSLEVIGGRFILENNDLAAVSPCLLRVRGGDLYLQNSYLQGPLDKAPAAFQALIRHEPTAKLLQPTATIAWRDCVLLSARKILDARSATARIGLKNCLILALDDGLVLDPGVASQPDYMLWLDHNTVAFRKSMLALRWSPESVRGWKPVAVQARENYFLDPFADGIRESSVWRFSASALTSGRLLWQGKLNAFDAGGLQSFFAPQEHVGRGRQSIREWHRIWGTAMEQDFQMVEAAKHVKPFVVDPPAFERLALPPQFRPGDEPPGYGADLGRLGVLKRK